MDLPIKVAKNSPRKSDLARTVVDISQYTSHPQES